LAADFGEEPAYLVGDLRQEHGGYGEDEEDAGELVLGLLEEAESPEAGACDAEADHGQAEGDHEVKELEGGLDGWVELFRDVVEASDDGFGIETDEEAEHAGYFGADGGLVLLVDVAEEGERDVAGGLVMAFHGSELGGLVLGNADRGFVAGSEGKEGGAEGHGDADFEGGGSELLVAFFNEVPGGDAHDHEGTGGPAAHEGVGEAVDGGRVEDDLPEIVDDHAGVAEVLGLHLVAHGHELSIDFEVGAGGGLLPGVGYDDPNGTEMSSEGDHAGGEEVEFWADLVPAEEKDGEETRLEEEGEDAFGGKGAPKDIADEAGVGCPVGAEFEFEDDAGGDTESEDETEYLGPEAGHVVEAWVTRLEPEAFHDDQDEAQTDGERRK